MASEIIFSTALMWFLIGLACIISEFFIPGVVLVFFGIGAWIVAVITYFTPISLLFQTLIFSVISIVALVTLRSRFIPDTKDGQPDITDDFIGKTAVVTEIISKDQPGRVTFKGALWKAETRTDQILQPGEYVKIVEQESIVLFVEPIKKE